MLDIDLMDMFASMVVRKAVKDYYDALMQRHRTKFDIEVLEDYLRNEETGYDGDYLINRVKAITDEDWKKEVIRLKKEEDRLYGSKDT